MELTNAIIVIITAVIVSFIAEKLFVKVDIYVCKYLHIPKLVVGISLTLTYAATLCTVLYKTINS